MKTVGIIGGFGPETTAKFFAQIVKLWAEENQVQRPEVLIWNAPVNLANESDLILNQRAESFLPLLVEGAMRLERAGADFLVLPCNTLHVFIDDIRKAVKIPVLSVSEEVGKDFDHNKSTAILATSTTLENEVFDSEKFITPTEESQLKLNSLIKNLVQNRKPSDNQILGEILEELKSRGAKNVLLACTDLQLLSPQSPGINFIDTFEILAKATVENMLRP